MRTTIFLTLYTNSWRFSFTMQKRAGLRLGNGLGQGTTRLLLPSLSTLPLRATDPEVERTKRSLRRFKMPQKACKESTFTFQTRARLDEHSSSILSSVAALLSREERSLFADIARGKTAASLKNSYLIKFGITARHFNAMRATVEGKISSIKEHQKLHMAELSTKISSLKAKIKKLQKKKAHVAVHQKKRRLARLQQELKVLKNHISLGKPPLCFGSRKLFRSQFALQQNGYESFDEWKNDWKSTSEQR